MAHERRPLLRLVSACLRRVSTRRLAREFFTVFRPFSTRVLPHELEIRQAVRLNQLRALSGRGIDAHHESQRQNVETTNHVEQAWLRVAENELDKGPADEHQATTRQHFLRQARRLVVQLHPVGRLGTHSTEEWQLQTVASVS